MGKFTYDINKYDPRHMVALPLALFIVSVIFLGFNTVTTGLPVEAGIDFSGGIAVTIFTDDSAADLEQYFKDYPLKSVGESINNGYYLVFDNIPDENRFQEMTKHIYAKYPDAGIDQIGETFGKTLQTQAFWAVLMAFILMAVVVFIAFRNFIASLTIVAAGVFDISITATLMDLIGFTLSLGTTAALLMLIGYSVDSNILLTTRLFKRQGRTDEKIANAFHTGFIMTTTTLVAVAVMFLVTFVGQIVIIRDISAVLLIGLLVDLMTTWMFNAGILKMYFAKKENPKRGAKQAAAKQSGAKEGGKNGRR